MGRFPTPGPASVGQLLLRPNGDVLATGNFSRSGSVVLDKAALRDGSSWRVLPWNALPGGRMYQDPTGALSATFATSVDQLRELNGTSWVTRATASGGYFRDVVPLGSGRYAVVGDFTSIDGVAARHAIATAARALVVSRSHRSDNRRSRRGSIPLYGFSGS